MIIITGGAGFIGFNVAQELHRSGKEVIIVDYKKFSTVNRNFSKLKDFNIVHPEKIFDFIRVNKNKIAAIVHMGAISSTAETNLNLLLKNNLQYSQRLFEISNAFEIKFIYASSASTYGNGSQGFDDDNKLMNFTKLNPINYYGLSKHLFDLRVLENLNLHKKVNSNPVGLKFFNVYGPYESHKGFMMSPIPKFYSEIKTKASLRLFKSHNPKYEDGMQSRDFIYIKDCVSVVDWFLNNKEKRGIFNVGTGQNKTFLNLASLVFNYLKIEKKIKFINTPREVRKGYQYMTKANIQSLRNVGYKKKFTTLNKGVKDYINNYLEK